MLTWGFVVGGLDLGVAYPQTLLVLGWGRAWEILIPWGEGPWTFQVLTNMSGLGIDLAADEPARSWGGS